MKKHFNKTDSAPSPGPNVIDYADASTALKDAMEKAMEPIDRTPDSFGAVITFGQTPLEILNGIRNQMLEKLNAHKAAMLEEARIHATRDLAVYIGAAKEVLRRYNEEYIREANKQLKESSDPEDASYLNEVLKRKADFISRKNVLEAARVDSIVVGHQLRKIAENDGKPPQATSDTMRGKKLPGKLKRLS